MSSLPAKHVKCYLSPSISTVTHDPSNSFSVCSATLVFWYSFPVSSALFSPDAHPFLKTFSPLSTMHECSYQEHRKCQANTSLLGFQTQQGDAVKSPPCPNTGEQSNGITHNVWGSPCPWPTTGQGGSTSLEDIGGVAEASGKCPFLLHSWKANWSHTPSGEQQHQRGPAPGTLLSSVCDLLQRQPEHGGLILYQGRCYSVDVGRFAFIPHFNNSMLLNCWYSMEGCWKICFYCPHSNMQPADRVHTSHVLSMTRGAMLGTKAE